MDERILNTSEALKILKKHYITDDIQMVTRFIRSERLKAEKDTRKYGYRIREVDLYEFIEEEKPGMIEVIYTFEKFMEQLHVKTDPEKYIQVLLAKKNDRRYKPETTSLPIVDDEVMGETSTDEQPFEEQKIDQVVSVTSESFPTNPSNDWIKELFANPSFQEKLSEWSRANPTNQVKSKTKTNKKEPRNKHKYQNLTFNKFLDMLNNQPTGKKILNLYSTEQLEFLHTCYYENGQMREELYDNKRNPSVFICPVSKKEKNQWLHLLVSTQQDIEKALEVSKASGDWLSSGEGEKGKEGDSAMAEEDGVPKNHP